MMGKKINLVYDGIDKFGDTICEICQEKTKESAMICEDCFNVLKELIMENKTKNKEITNDNKNFENINRARI